MTTLLIRPPRARVRRIFLALIVAIVAFNLLAFYPSKGGFSARYNILEDGGTNDIFARVVVNDDGRFGLAVRLSEHAPGAVIYRAPTDDIVGRAASQNLLGIGRATDVIEVPRFSNEWLEGADYDSRVVAEVEPYDPGRSSSPLATGQPWAIALDPGGDHKEFALFDVPMERFDGARGLLLVEVSGLPHFPADVLKREVDNAA